jgi:predicted ATPase/Tfp pilus assembly protein PilF
MLQKVITEHGGQVFKTVGDAFYAAFTIPYEAASAALAIQRAILGGNWGDTAIKIRIILHTGTAEERDGDFFGPSVNRSARLLSVGHGGQILLSSTTRALVQSRIPADTPLRDLGEHRLKDLDQVEQIYQLLAPDLPDSFPPLKTLSTFPNNLPVQLSTFVGRKDEIDEVIRRLDSVRALTLIGAGGTGKTRLAQQAAAKVVEDFADGIWYVELAPVTNSTLVAQTVAKVLQVDEEPARAIVETLVDELKTKKILLILDNCEHLIDACADLAMRLLQTCPDLCLLSTSREVLEIPGEISINVPPLALPKRGDQPSANELAGYSAIRLFIERADAVVPGFVITEKNGPAVLQICWRLDGIPLAIELAAAKLKILQVEEIALRLDDRFHLLTGGSRTALPRHQTLRAMMDWSYGLLFDKERLLFQRLAVFSGGWTLEAAENICADHTVSNPDILDLLLHLTNKSLILAERKQGIQTRYQMLETMRQYGQEKLAESGEILAIRGKHLKYSLGLVEQADSGLYGPEQISWYERLENERDNLRSALEWSKRSDIETALFFASSLLPFWQVRGHLSEGRKQLSDILFQEEATFRTTLRASGLAAAGLLAYRQSDYSATRALNEESLSISREVGDKSGVARALMGLANVDTEKGDYESAPAMIKEALELYRQLGDDLGTAQALLNLGWATMRPGDYVAARGYLEEALAFYESAGDRESVAFVQAGLGEVAIREGKLEQAADILEKSLALRKQIGDQWGTGVSLGSLGWIALQQGRYGDARTILEDSLTVRNVIGDKGGMAWCLEHLAEVAMSTGEPKRAVVLFGKAADLRESIGSVIDPVDQPKYEENLSQLRDSVGDDQFSKEWDFGRSLAIDQLVTEPVGGHQNV